jgi:hypothetical protein
MIDVLYKLVHFIFIFFFVVSLGFVTTICLLVIVNVNVCPS